MEEGLQCPCLQGKDYVEIKSGKPMGSERGWGQFCKEQMDTALLEHLRDADLGWRESALRAPQGLPAKQGAGLT